MLALVGDFARFDDPRAIVKLAGSEVNHYASGDWKGTSRISHRGRSTLRAAAYQQARQLVAKNEDFRSRFHTLIHRTTRRPLTLKAAYVAVVNSFCASPTTSSPETNSTAPSPNDSTFS